MTRQIALGAVIAFTVTVLALSVWEPKPPVAEPPPPVVMPMVPTLQKPFRPATLRPEALNRILRQPAIVAQPLVTDAGAPAP